MMNILTYSHAKDFLADTLNPLMQEEAVNNLMLGLCLSMSKQSENAESLFFSLKNNQDKVLGCCIQTDPEKNLIVWAEDKYSGVFVEEMNQFLTRERIQIPGILGKKKLAGAFLKEYIKGTSSTLGMVFDQGVYELRRLIVPRKTEGTVRLAQTSDIEVISRWMRTFMLEAMGKHLTFEQSLEQVKAFIEAQVLYVWEHQGLASMTATSRATPNGICINYVYTPKERRGKGYASNLVATLSAELLKKYEFCSLFTDLANSTSNGIYQRMGYKQVANFATYTVEDTAQSLKT